MHVAPNKLRLTSCHSTLLQLWSPTTMLASDWVTSPTVLTCADENINIRVQAIAGLKAKSAQLDRQAIHKYANCRSNRRRAKTFAYKAQVLIQQPVDNKSVPTALRLIALQLRRATSVDQAQTAVDLMIREADSNDSKAQYVFGWAIEMGVVDTRRKLALDYNNILVECMSRMLASKSDGELVLIPADWAAGCEPLRPVPQYALAEYNKAADQRFGPALLWEVGYAAEEGSESKRKMLTDAETLLHEDDPIVLGLFALYSGFIPSLNRDKVSEAWSTKCLPKLRSLASDGSAEATDLIVAFARGNPSLSKAEYIEVKELEKRAFLQRERLAQIGDSMDQYKFAMALKTKHQDAQAGSAINWLQKSAERGNPFAQRELREMYSSGDGVSRDREKAEYWQQKAASSGLPAK